MSTDRRLTSAAERLRRSDDKIVTIAEDAGFENLSNFNRQFKARYGMTPPGIQEILFRKKSKYLLTFCTLRAIF